MLRRKLVKALTLVLCLALLISSLPVAGLLVSAEVAPTIYDFDSRYANIPVAIDGEINEAAWNISQELTLSDSTVPNSAASFGTLWDEDNLYIAFDVTDSSRVSSGKEANEWTGEDGPWLDDSVEVYIDGNNSKTAGYDSSDVQYLFRWYDAALTTGNNTNVGDIIVYNNTNSNATINGILYVAKAKADGTGYIVEISIPWESMGGLTAEAGKVLGITTHLNDCDQVDSSTVNDYLGYTTNYGSDWAGATNWANMTLTSVIFNDDCSDLSTWNIVPEKNTADAIYVTDSTNPLSPEPNAPAGEFKFYANYTNSLHNAVDIFKPVTLTDNENWTLNVNMKIDSLQKVGAGLVDYDGFVLKLLTSTPGRYFYMLFSEDGVKVRNSSTPTAPITTIGDGNYHDYSFSWNPAESELAFAIDGVPITTFANFSAGSSEGGLFIMTMTNYSRGSSNSGVASVYVNSASITRQPPANPNILVDSACDSITSEGWAVEGGSGTAVLNDTEKAGNFYLYADTTLRDDSTKTISKTINLSHNEKWALDMNMQIDKLKLIYDDYKCYYGLNINVADGEKQFKIHITQEGVSVNANDHTSIATIPLPAGIIGDGKYHKYGFAWDGLKNLIFAVDGVKMGSFTGIDLPNTGKYFSITSDNYMAGDGTAPNQPSGEQEAYIDSISLTKNVTPQWALYNSKIKFVNILPESDAAGVEAMIIMEEIPEDMINSETYEVQVNIYNGDIAGTPIAAAVSPVLGEKFIMSIPGLSPDVLYTIKAQLIKKPANITMNSYEREFRLDAEVETIAKDSVLNGEQDKTYLYKDVKSMAESTHNWMAGTYSYDDITDYDYVENKDNAGALSLPLTGTGKYAVYVGYLNGTEEFKVSNSKTTSNVVVIPQRSRTPHNEMTLYGARSMSEVFATVVDYSEGEGFSITPIDGAYARIAYIKLKPMTDADVELWNRQSDGVDRLVYNNDGFSDFFEGYYTDVNGNPDIQGLLDTAINRYIGKDVAALDWALGTTLALNHESEYVSTELWENINKVMTGKSLEITDLVKRQQAKEIWVRLRSGDELVIKGVLNYINNNLSPLQLLETRGDQLGIDVNVSIRMEAFYDPAGDDRWLNGTDYANFTRVETASGSKCAEISLADKNFQDYTINILRESVVRYGADGVNLDFDRYPYVLGYELADYGYENLNITETLYAAKREVVNTFMRRVRDELPEGTVISARIPINESGDQFGTGRGYKNNGLDFETWTMEGLIDILIPSDISYEEFHSLTPFVDAVNAAKEAGKDVTLYCGITNDLGGHDLTKDEEDLINQGIQVDRSSVTVSTQQYRLRALEAFNTGAEKIYIFNSWKGPTSLGYIGDKVALEKWYGLAYEVESVQNLAGVKTSVAVGDTYNPPVVVVPPVVIVTPAPTTVPTPEVTPTPVPASFTDVEGNWAHNAIMTLAKAGVLNGYSDGTVRPNANATRAEFVTMVMKMMKQEAKTSASFTDTASSAWYMKAVSLAVEKGWIKGRDDGSFGPDDNVTREEAIVIMSRVLDGLGVTATSDSSVLDAFKDAGNVSSWAKADVAKLVGLGIIKGSGNMIKPKDNITRAEISTILVKILEAYISK